MFVIKEYLFETKAVPNLPASFGTRQWLGRLPAGAEFNISYLGNAEFI